MGVWHKLAKVRIPANSSLWNSGGNAIFAACQWGLLALLARENGPAEVGRYAYALAVTTPIAMFLNLGLRDGQSSVGSSGVPFSAFLRTRAVTLAVGFALLLGAAVGGLQIDPLVFAVAVTKAAESLSDICYGHFQRTERLDLVARSVLVRGVGGLVVFGVGLNAGAGTTLAVVQMAVLWLAITFCWDLRSAARLRVVDPVSTSVEHSSTRSMIHRHLPLGITALLVALNVNAPRYVIEDAFGETALGLFVAAWYLQVAGVIVVNSLGQARVIHLSRALRLGQGFSRLLFRFVGKVALLGLFGGVCALILGETFLQWFYGPPFVSGWTCLVVIAFGSVVTFSATALNFGLTAMGDFRGQSLAALAHTATTIAASFVLIPEFGIVGGACAMLVGTSVNIPIALIRLRCALGAEG